MKTNKILSMVMALGAACAALGVDYDPAKHGNPIEILGDEAVEIDGKGATIDARGKSRCATLGPNVTLRNFVLKNGFAELGGGVYGGTVVNCTITGCRATESAAALCNSVAENCTITGNSFENGSSTAAAHGGILFGSALTGCTVSGNTVTFGSEAPAFGGIGEQVTLTGCTISNNTVTAGEGICYGMSYAYSTINGSEVEFDDADASTPPTPPTPPDPPGPPDPPDPPDPPGPPDPPDPPEDPFDGTVANNYVVRLQDGSTLVISTAKQTVKKGVATSVLKAKLTVGKKTYSYAGGKITDGVVTALPVCRTAGAPQFGELALTRDGASGVFAAQDIGGNRLRQEDFDDDSIGWRQQSVSRVGVAFLATASVSERCGSVKFSASKLPSGLKIDKTTGVISGVPTKANEFRTKVTATSSVSSKLKGSTEFEIGVEALDDWAIGTFNGGGDDCQVKITVSKTGKISGQLQTGGLKWTLSAKSFDGYEEGAYVATLTSKNGRTVRSCEIALSENGLVGVDETGGEFNALRNCWKDYPWKTISKAFTKAAPVSYAPTGFADESSITLKFASSGSVTAKGQFVKSYNDGTGKPSFYSASCSTVLCPAEDPDEAGAFTGVVYIYYPPKKNTPIPSGYIDCVSVRWTGSQFLLVR